MALNVRPLTEDERRVVEANMKFVRIAVRRITPAGSRCSEDDRQSGAVGLIRAVKAWRGDGNFAAFAFRQIYYAIYEHRSLGSLIRVKRKAYEAGERPPEVGSLERGWAESIACRDEGTGRAEEMSTARAAVNLLEPRPREIVDRLLEGDGLKAIVADLGVPQEIARRSASASYERIGAMLGKPKPADPPPWCAGVKIGYRKKAEAREAIYKLHALGRHQPEKGRLSEYWCKTCRTYHIGHDGRPRRADVQAMAPYA